MSVDIRRCFINVDFDIVKWEIVCNNYFQQSAYDERGLYERTRHLF